VGLVFLIEFFSDVSELTMFELGDLDRAPALGGTTVAPASDDNPLSSKFRLAIKSLTG
jgi:hypothetical protein